MSEVNLVKILKSGFMVQHTSLDVANSPAKVRRRTDQLEILLRSAPKMTLFWPIYNPLILDFKSKTVPKCVTLVRQASLFMPDPKVKVRRRTEQLEIFSPESGEG